MKSILAFLAFSSLSTLAACQGSVTTTPDGTDGGTSSGSGGGSGSSAGSTSGSSSGSAGGCATSTPCGGDLTGTWNYISACASGSDTLSGTCDETIQSANIQVSGTFTWATDMTYTSEVTVSGSVAVEIPASCFTSLGASMTCDELSEFATSASLSMTCTDSAAGGCTCTETLSAASSPTSNTGSYTQSGDVITLTSSAGVTNQYGYCVSGSQLTLIPQDSSALPSGGLSGTMILEKQ